MNNFKGRIRQLHAAMTGTLFAITDGMTYGWTAPYIPYLLSNKSHIQTTKEEAEWLETALLLGSLCGLPLTLYFVDKFGRKKALLLAALTIFIAWTLIGVANKMTYLFVARFMCGMAEDMAFVAAPMYMAEIADKKIRGLLSGIIYIMVQIGCLLVYCIGPYVSYYVTPIVAASVVLTQLIVFSFFPETPYYLVRENRLEDAKKAVAYFRPFSDVEKEIQDIINTLAMENENKGRIQDLFMVKSNRKGIIIMTVLNAGQHLCAYSVILMNLHQILEAAGSAYMDSSLAAILFAGIMLVAALFCSLQVDKYGRKRLLIVSSIVSGICLFVIAIYFNLKSSNFNILTASWIPILAVMVYAAFFKIGVGIVPLILTAELFPTNIKAIGATVSDAMFIIGGLIALQIYQRLAALLGMYAPFYFFGMCSFSIALFTHLYIPETKGSSLDEIQAILKRGSPRELNYI